MSIEWYHEAIEDDDDGGGDFEGCPYCLGGCIERIGSSSADEKYKTSLYQCLECHGEWHLVDIPMQEQD